VLERNYDTWNLRIAGNNPLCYQKAVEQTDFKKGRDFEKIASQLGI